LPRALEVLLAIKSSLVKELLRDRLVMSDLEWLHALVILLVDITDPVIKQNLDDLASHLFDMDVEGVVHCVVTEFVLALFSLLEPVDMLNDLIFAICVPGPVVLKTH
jgi:hypothetical protein